MTMTPTQHEVIGVQPNYPHTRYVGLRPTRVWLRDTMRNGCCTVVPNSLSNHCLCWLDVTVTTGVSGIIMDVGKHCAFVSCGKLGMF